MAQEWMVIITIKPINVKPVSIGKFGGSVLNWNDGGNAIGSNTSLPTATTRSPTTNDLMIN
jgi:hypothetical protein